MDTCDSRGSVAVLRDEAVLKVVVHESEEDYSIWLLPAVRECLAGGGIRMEDVEAYAVTAGPGSFTGVRVGLTTVKAWAEVYGKRIVAVSRLEALAGEAKDGTDYVAAFANAQRGQVYGAVYQRNGTGPSAQTALVKLERLGEDAVLAPGKFIEEAAKFAGDGRITWISTDPECVLSDEGWKRREACGEKIERVSNVRAPMIGRIGLRELAAGRSTDVLALDANYVRRPDAEVFWKSGGARGS